MALWEQDRQSAVRLRYSGNVPRCFNQGTCIILVMEMFSEGWSGSDK